MTMRHVVFVMVVAALVTSCEKRNEDNEDIVRVPVAKSKAQVPSITVYVNNEFENPDGIPKVIFAVWPDGTAVYSTDQIQGGPPYYEKEVSPEKTDDFFKRLEKGNFLQENTCEAYIGIDTAFTGIFVTRNGNTTVLFSDHELYEVDPRCIGTQHGIEALEGRSRETVIKTWNRKYRAFRHTWDFLRSEAEKLLQLEESGELAETIEFEYKDRIISW